MKRFQRMPDADLLIDCTVALMVTTAVSIAATVALKRHDSILVGAAFHMSRYAIRPLCVITALLLAATCLLLKSENRLKWPTHLRLTRTQWLNVCKVMFGELTVAFSGLTIYWDSRPGVIAGRHFWVSLCEAVIAFVATAVTATVKAHFDPPK